MTKTKTPSTNFAARKKAIKDVEFFTYRDDNSGECLTVVFRHTEGRSRVFFEYGGVSLQGVGTGYGHDRRTAAVADLLREYRDQLTEWAGHMSPISTKLLAAADDATYGWERVMQAQFGHPVARVSI